MLSYFYSPTSSSNENKEKSANNLENKNNSKNEIFNLSPLAFYFNESKLAKGKGKDKIEENLRNLLNGSTNISRLISDTNTKEYGLITLLMKTFPEAKDALNNFIASIQDGYHSDNQTYTIDDILGKKEVKKIVRQHIREKNEIQFWVYLAIAIALDELFDVKGSLRPDIYSLYFHEKIVTEFSNKFADENKSLQTELDNDNIKKTENTIKMINDMPKTISDQTKISLLMSYVNDVIVCNVVNQLDSKSKNFAVFYQIFCDIFNHIPDDICSSDDYDDPIIDETITKKIHKILSNVPATVDSQNLRTAIQEFISFYTTRNDLVTALNDNQYSEELRDHGKNILQEMLKPLAQAFSTSPFPVMAKVFASLTTVIKNPTEKNNWDLLKKEIDDLNKPSWGATIAKATVNGAGLIGAGALAYTGFFMPAVASALTTASFDIGLLFRPDNSPMKKFLDLQEKHIKQNTAQKKN